MCLAFLVYKGPKTKLGLCCWESKIHFSDPTLRALVKFYIGLVQFCCLVPVTKDVYGTTNFSSTSDFWLETEQDVAAFYGFDRRLTRKVQNQTVVGTQSSKRPTKQPIDPNLFRRFLIWSQKLDTSPQSRDNFWDLVLIFASRRRFLIPSEGQIWTN